MSSTIASLGESLRQQDDLHALVTSIASLAEVAIYAEAKGATESEVDAALGARRVRGGKKNGLALIVAQPIELPEPKGSDPLLMIRTHIVRVIEAPEINRKSGGTQITADAAKDAVLQRLHNRYLGQASLQWAGTEPWTDEKGGYGWQVAFSIRADLPSERRYCTPIISIDGAGLCTLLGAGEPGEILYYTLDGTAPVPGGPAPLVYAAPFAVSGQTVRASAMADDYELGDFALAIAPTLVAGDNAVLTPDGDPVLTPDGDPVLRP